MQMTAFSVNEKRRFVPVQKFNIGLPIAVISDNRTECEQKDRNFQECSSPISDMRLPCSLGNQNSALCRSLGAYQTKNEECSCAAYNDCVKKTPSVCYGNLSIMT